MRKAMFVVIVLVMALGMANIVVAAEELTQGEYTVKIVDLLGIEGELPADAAVNDYADLLVKKGIQPRGGFQLDQEITKQEMADLLAQVMGIDKSKISEQDLRGKAVINACQGDVQVMLDSGEKWIKAEPGMVLNEKAIIKTGKESTASVMVGAISAILIKANTEVSLYKLMTKPDEFSEDIVLSLKSGEIIADAYNMTADSDFRVVSPTSVAAVRGTVYVIKVSGQEVQADDLMQ